MDNTQSTPGTSEFDEHIDHQGQAAMHAALVHPIVRVFFGALFLAGLATLVAIYQDLFLGQYPFWRKIVHALATLWIFGIFLAELGSVTMFGKSLTPWYYDMMRRWRPKP